MTTCNICGNPIVCLGTKWYHVLAGGTNPVFAVATDPALDADHEAAAQYFLRVCRNIPDADSEEAVEAEVDVVPVELRNGTWRHLDGLYGLDRLAGGDAAQAVGYVAQYLQPEEYWAMRVGTVTGSVVDITLRITTKG